MKILGFSGSLRAGSSNAALLRAAAALAPPGTQFRFFDEELADIPAFNPDLDGVGATPPPAVARLRALVAAADGVLITSPEYAHGVPGAFKNALDWLVSSGELEGKPTVLVVASPGGGEQARAALTPTLEVLGARLVANFAATFTRTRIDGDGKLRDPELAGHLKAGLEALAAAVGGS